MRPDINAIIPAFAVLTSIVLLLVIEFSRQPAHIKRSFQAFLLGLFLWSISALVTQVEPASSPAWHRLIFTGMLAMALGAFHLVHVVNTNRQAWHAAVYFGGLTAIVLNTFTDLFIQPAVLAGSLPDYRYTMLGLFILAPGLTLFLLNSLELRRSRRQAEESSRRNRLRYFIAGRMLLAAGLLAGTYPDFAASLGLLLGNLAALWMVLSILKQYLVDIDVVIRRGILYIVPTTVIGALYFLFITLAFKLFDAASGFQLFLVSMLVAILSAILVQPQYERIRLWIDRLFFREKYDSGLMLQRISRTATSLLEVNMLANMILDEISATLHIEKSGFILKDKQSREFSLIVHRGLGKNANIRLRADHPIVQRLSEAEETVTRRDTEILPQFKSLWDEEKAVLELIGAELYIPLRSQGELIGMLAVGRRRSNEPYSQDDQASLTTLGNQVAVAIENARLYTTEQTRRKELDSLYTLSRKLIATDAMKTVLDNVAEHALESIHVTFIRIALRNEHGSFICRAVLPVYGLEYDLGLGRMDARIVNRFYDAALNNREPLVIDRHQATLTTEERKALFLDQVHSLCLCPLSIGEEPIGILIMGERRHVHRESFDAEKLRLASAIADQAAGAIRRVRLHEQLEESFVQTILALANAMDAKDNYTNDHGERLARLATLTAEKLDCSPQEVQAINWGMRLHDIGKIGVPDEVLQKPGALNDQEWRLMRRHPEIGANIIAPVKNLHTVVPIILHHHERYDGNGYPHKLAGDQIPLGARIIAVVDTYGAITDKRVYRKARPHNEAIVEIERCTGTQFDPRVAGAFTDVIRELVEKQPPQRDLVGEAELRLA